MPLCSIYAVDVCCRFAFAGSCLIFRLERFFVVSCQEGVTEYCGL
jgi:hypothetical protein